MLRNFYSCTIECILSGSITTWMGSCTKQDFLTSWPWKGKSVQPSGLSEGPSPTCKTFITDDAGQGLRKPNHPGKSLFSLLLSGQRFCCLRTNTESIRRSFFPHTIYLFNSERKTGLCILAYSSSLYMYLLLYFYILPVILLCAIFIFFYYFKNWMQAQLHISLCIVQCIIAYVINKAYLTERFTWCWCWVSSARTCEARFSYSPTDQL